MKYVVLGCGPAGLVAAHAAVLSDPDADVRILSKPRKSYMKGAQYLHAPIPMMGDQEPFDIDYQLIGSPTEYAKKVYDGHRVQAEDTSAAVLRGIHPGWDIRSAYDALWAAYGPYVREWEASPEGVAHLISGWKPDLIISSVPAPLICAVPHEHYFLAEKIWSTDKALGVDVDNTVICNGAKYPAWYRSSLIQGWGNTEWPARTPPPVKPLWDVTKPIDTNCTCFPQVMRVGRYGKWAKGILVHHVLEDVVRTVSKTGVQEALW